MNMYQTYTIPKWTTIAKTYNLAVEEMLKRLGKKRTLVNYREGKLGPEYLQESEKKRACMSVLNQQKGETITFSAQLGEKYKGKSVQEARRLMGKNECGLGVYEVVSILLLNPNILIKWEDLWIDCAGDEYSTVANGSVGGAPYFSFGGGRVGFGASGVDSACGYCGSASAFLPQSFENRELESFENRLLKLEQFQKSVENYLKL